MTVKNDDLLTLEEIKILLEDKRLYVVAKKTGLTYPTIKKFADGKAENCAYVSLIKINKYLKPYADDTKMTIPKKSAI